MDHLKTTFKALSFIYTQAGFELSADLKQRLTKICDEFKLGKTITVCWRKLSSCTRITTYCHDECIARTAPLLETEVAVDDKSLEDALIYELHTQITEQSQRNVHNFDIQLTLSNQLDIQAKVMRP